MDVFTRDRKESGSSLVEVLVASFILSIGLLGMAFMTHQAIGDLRLGIQEAEGMFALQTLHHTLSSGSAYQQNKSNEIVAVWLAHLPGALHHSTYSTVRKNEHDYGRLIWQVPKTEGLGMTQLIKYTFNQKVWHDASFS